MQLELSLKPIFVKKQLVGNIPCKILNGNWPVSCSWYNKKLIYMIFPVRFTVIIKFTVGIPFYLAFFRIIRFQ